MVERRSPVPNYRHLRRLERLKRQFEELGIRPRIRMGQNFLLDKNQVNYIAGCGRLSGEDVVLEVGPGTGFLSQVMAATGCTVFAVELDRKLLAMARAATRDFPNVVFMQGDILAGKSSINPEVLERLEELMRLRGPETRLKTVSNLPYSAGTPFVANLFSSPLPWARAVFLLQYEVAERMVAGPASRAYGSLSIVGALGGRVKLERKVPPQVFWPRPRVASAVVSIDFLSMEERMKIPWKALRRVCVGVFNSRRKTLRNALKGLFEPERVAGIAAANNLDLSRRGSDMTPSEFLLLARELERSS